MDYREQICLHEAGHAVSLMASGVPVDKVVARSASGYCEGDHARIVDDYELIRMCYAGAAAVDVLANEVSAEESPGDYAIAEPAIRRQGLFPGTPRWRGLMASVRAFVGGYADAIFFIAQELRQRSELNRVDMRRLCLREHSPIRQFKGLYPPRLFPSAASPNRSNDDDDDFDVPSVSAAAALKAKPSGCESGYLAKLKQMYSGWKIEAIGSGFVLKQTGAQPFAVYPHLGVWGRAGQGSKLRTVVPSQLDLMGTLIDLLGKTS